MLSRFAVLLLIPAVCFVSGCGGSGGGDNVQGDFSSGEMKEFKDEFVQVVKDLIAKAEADGKSGLLAEGPALQQRVYDKYPQNAGASENAITDLIDRLDLIMDEANESQIDGITSRLQKLLADVETL